MMSIGWTVIKNSHIRANVIIGNPRETSAWPGSGGRRDRERPRWWWIDCVSEDMWEKQLRANGVWDRGKWK